MKSFVLTVILFCLLISVIVINSLYTKNIANEIEKKITDLDFEEEITDELNEIQEYWEKQEKIVGISVGFKEIDKTCELIISLKTYYQYQNKQEFERVKLLLLDVIEEITRLEKFNLR